GSLGRARPRVYRDGYTAHPANVDCPETTVITCKVCGFENDKGAQFCGNCGSFLEWTGEKDAEPAPDTTQNKPTTTPDGGTGPSPAPQPIPPPPPPPPPPTGIICPNCGTLNPSDRVFCQNCAAELNPVPAQPLPPTPGPGGGPLSGKVGPAILIAALAAVGVV